MSESKFDENAGKDNSEVSSESTVFPEEIQTIIEDADIPQEKKYSIIKAFFQVTSIKQSSTFRGPIPPPEVLKGYNDIIENGAERILTMAEKQSTHRMQLENHAIREELKQSRLGQVFGFILGIVGFGLATFLALYGHETIAGIFGTTTIIGLVTVFVLGKKSQHNDLEEKQN
jgi:uncharacterized membrane protein